MRTSTSEYVDAYLWRFELNNYSHNTIGTYRYNLRRFTAYMAEHGLERIHQVTERHLVGFLISLRERGLAPRTVHARFACAAKFFAWLTEEGELLLNPAEHLQLKEPRLPLLDVPTEQDVERLLAQPDTGRPVGVRDRAIMEIIYGSGLRRGEICAMTLRDVDIPRRRIRVMGKGRRERVVPMSAQAARWLDAYVQHARYTFRAPAAEAALWLGVFGRPLDKPGVTQMVAVHRERAGIVMQITPHALRRACATHMLRNGAHPVSVQHLLGHASLAHLSRYLEVTIRDLKRTHRRSKPGR